MCKLLPDSTHSQRNEQGARGIAKREPILRAYALFAKKLEQVEILGRSK